MTKKKKVVVRVMTGEKRCFVTAGCFKRGFGGSPQERARVALELGISVLEQAGLWPL